MLQVFLLGVAWLVVLFCLFGWLFGWLVDWLVVLLVG